MLTMLQSLVKLSPEHADFRQLDLAWMDHCEKVKALRQHTPSDALTVCAKHFQNNASECASHKTHS